MFSKAQKQYIAEGVEKLLLSLNHPEMTGDFTHFKLEVAGREDWSHAVIQPNWMFLPDYGKPGDPGIPKKEPGVNPWNEFVATRMSNPPAA